MIKAKKSIGLCAVEQRKRRINEKKTFNSKQGNKSGPFEQWPRAVQIIIVIAVNNLRYRGKKKQNENVEYSCLQFPLLFNCLVHTALLHSSARLQPTFINVRCASFTVAAIYFFFWLPVKCSHNSPSFDWCRIRLVNRSQCVVLRDLVLKLFSGSKLRNEDSERTRC